LAHLYRLHGNGCGVTTILQLVFSLRKLTSAIHFQVKPRKSVNILRICVDLSIYYRYETFPIVFASPRPTVGLYSPHKENARVFT